LKYEQDIDIIKGPPKVISVGPELAKKSPPNTSPVIFEASDRFKYLLWRGSVKMDEKTENYDPYHVNYEDEEYHVNDNDDEYHVNDNDDEYHVTDKEKTHKRTNERIPPLTLAAAYILKSFLQSPIGKFLLPKDESDELKKQTLEEFIREQEERDKARGPPKPATVFENATFNRGNIEYTVESHRHPYVGIIGWKEYIHNKDTNTKLERHNGSRLVNRIYEGKKEFVRENGPKEKFEKADAYFREICRQLEVAEYLNEEKKLLGKKCPKEFYEYGISIPATYGELIASIKVPLDEYKKRKDTRVRLLD